MNRTITIDLTNERPITAFGGYEQEHNATTLHIVLPPEMRSDDVVCYVVDFETSYGEQFHSTPILRTSGMEAVDVTLWQQLMCPRQLLVQVSGYDQDLSDTPSYPPPVGDAGESGTVQCLRKTPVITLLIEPSAEGDVTPEDASFYRVDEEVLQTMAEVQAIVSDAEDLYEAFLEAQPGQSVTDWNDALTTGFYTSDATAAHVPTTQNPFDGANWCGFAINRGGHVTQVAFPTFTGFREYDFCWFTRYVQSSSLASSWTRLDAGIGDVSTLETEATTLVGAINELQAGKLPYWVLSEFTNADTLTETGYYTGMIGGLPTTANGVLVSNLGNEVVQTVFSSYENGKLFQRKLSNGTWSGLRKILDNTDIIQSFDVASSDKAASAGMTWYLNQSLGDVEELSTEATTAVGAINELHAKKLDRHEVASADANQLTQSSDVYTGTFQNTPAPSGTLAVQNTFGENHTQQLAQWFLSDGAGGGIWQRTYNGLISGGQQGASFRKWGQVGVRYPGEATLAPGTVCRLDGWYQAANQANLKVQWHTRSAGGLDQDSSIGTDIVVPLEASPQAWQPFSAVVEVPESIGSATAPYLYLQLDSWGDEADDLWKLSLDNLTLQPLEVPYTADFESATMTMTLNAGDAYEHGYGCTFVTASSQTPAHTGEIYASLGWYGQLALRYPGADTLVPGASYTLHGWYESQWACPLRLQWRDRATDTDDYDGMDADETRSELIEVEMAPTMTWKPFSITVPVPENITDSRLPYLHVKAALDNGYAWYMSLDDLCLYTESGAPAWRIDFEDAEETMSLSDDDPYEKGYNGFFSADAACAAGPIALSAWDRLLTASDLEAHDKADPTRLRRYGVKFGGSANSGSTVTRLYDAEGLAAGVGTDTETATNDFDSLAPWSARKRCCGSFDSAGRFLVNAYEGEPGYTTDGTAGEVWVEHSLFYYRHENGADGSEEVALSPYPLPGYAPAPLFVRPDGTLLQKAYTAAYPMATVDGQATSRAGVFPDSYSLNTAMTAARTLGDRYTVTTTAEWYTEWLYMVVEFATRDLQSVMKGATELPFLETDTAALSETGVNRVILPTASANRFVVGQTIGIGTALGTEDIAQDRVVTAIEDYDTDNRALSFDGDPVDITAGNVVFSSAWKNGTCDGVLASSGSPGSNTDGKHTCVYRGKETPYGNAFEWIADLLFTRTGAGTTENPYVYEAYYLPDATQYAAGAVTENYVKLSYRLPDTDGYITKLGKDSRFPHVRLPEETGGSSTTGYADIYNKPAYTVAAANVGGHWHFGTQAGACCWFCFNAPSIVNSKRRARLGCQ